MLGQMASITKKITEEDITVFSQISLDVNPVHLDDEFAKKTIFEKRIAHGFLVGSLISAVIANKLPGVGSIYLKQELNFKRPVFIGDQITAEVEVIEIVKPTVYRLATRCINQEGHVVIDGYAIIKKA